MIKNSKKPGKRPKKVAPAEKNKEEIIDASENNDKKRLKKRIKH